MGGTDVARVHGLCVWVTCAHLVLKSGGDRTYFPSRLAHSHSAPGSHFQTEKINIKSHEKMHCVEYP